MKAFNDAKAAGQSTFDHINSPNSVESSNGLAEDELGLDADTDVEEQREQAVASNKVHAAMKDDESEDEDDEDLDGDDNDDSDDSDESSGESEAKEPKEMVPPPPKQPSPVQTKSHPQKSSKKTGLTAAPTVGPKPSPSPVPAAEQSSNPAQIGKPKTTKSKTSKQPLAGKDNETPSSDTVGGAPEKYDFPLDPQLRKGNRAAEEAKAAAAAKEVPTTKNTPIQGLKRSADGPGGTTDTPKKKKAKKTKENAEVQPSSSLALHTSPQPPATVSSPKAEAKSAPTPNTEVKKKKKKRLHTQDSSQTAKEY
jgi:hypothetical protein